MLIAEDDCPVTSTQIVSQSKKLSVFSIFFANNVPYTEVQYIRI